MMEKDFFERLRQFKKETEGMSAKEIAAYARRSRRRSESEGPPDPVHDALKAAVGRLKTSTTAQVRALLHVRRPGWARLREFYAAYHAGNVDVASLARQVGVSPSTVRAWGRLRWAPNAANLKRLADTLTARRIGLAHHEAGHFVASYVLTPGWYRGTITIRPNHQKSTAGVCLTEDSLRETGDCEAEVMVLLAGYAAEKRADADADPRHSWSDTERALECIEWIGQVGSEHEWRAKADAFVAKEWEGIEALARELLGRETLDSTEAEIVVDIARSGND